MVQLERTLPVRDPVSMLKRINLVIRACVWRNPVSLRASCKYTHESNAMGRTRTGAHNMSYTLLSSDLSPPSQPARPSTGLVSANSWFVNKHERKLVL